MNRRDRTDASRALFYDTRIQILAEDEHRQIIQILGEQGEGLMSCYQVFPGVSLLFNDFHMKRVESQFTAGAELFCIDHCREGRIEQEIARGAYFYLTAGDVFFDVRRSGERHVEFPSGHYHGVSVAFDLGLADKSLAPYFQDVPLSIGALKKKYCDGRSNTVLHGDSGLERIFADLYSVPAQIRIPWFRVKVLELLLYLSALEVPGVHAERPYFFKEYVEKAKAIHTLMTENLAVHYTLEELSKRFDFPMTSMKNTFKAIYGDSIFSYMRSYRIDQAAALLRNERERSVLEIAGMMGYESPGKFSTAFKAIMNCSPLAYRKKTPH